MSLDVVWTVNIGGIDSSTDFTDRVTGISIRQPLRWMRIPSHTAVLTLLNNDGALTPADGGGAGTYANVDWLAQAVFIQATVNGTDTAEVFHGVIRTFQLADDGTSSTVILNVIDGLTFVSRQTRDSFSSSQYLSPPQAIADNIGGVADLLPALDKTAARVQVYPVTDDAYTVHANAYELSTQDANTPQTISDLLVTQVMPSGLSAIWATRIIEDPIDSTAVQYDIAAVGPTLNRVSDSDYGPLVDIPAYLEPQSFTLVETSPAAGELTFTRLDMGYNVDDRYNSASVTSTAVFVGTKTFAFNDPALETKYGTSEWRATSTLNNFEVSIKSQAGGIVNRFGPVVFTVSEVELTTANLADNPSTSKEELAALLDSANLWQRCDIEYTPTGAAGSKTVEAVIFGRRINARPGNTTITLDLVPAELFTSFILNSSTLGVLDTDRIA